MDERFSFEQIIAVLTGTFAQLEAKALQENDFADLSMKQIVYLDEIAGLEKPTPSDLAKKFGISKPSVTAMLGKLIQKGYVEKVPSETDRRSFFVLLTEKGRAIHEAHTAIHRQIAQHFSDALDESELFQLAALLHKALFNK